MLVDMHTQVAGVHGDIREGDGREEVDAAAYRSKVAQGGHYAYIFTLRLK